MPTASGKHPVHSRRIMWCQLQISMHSASRYRNSKHFLIALIPPTLASVHRSANSSKIWLNVCRRTILAPQQNKVTGSKVWWPNIKFDALQYPYDRVNYHWAKDPVASSETQVPPTQPQKWELRSFGHDTGG